MRLSHPAAALLLLGLLLTASAQDTAKRYGVRDEAGLFGKDAIKKAEEDFAKVHDQYKKDVFVEVLKDGPKDDFVKWAEDRARQHRFSGVYVVITENPKKLEVLTDRQTREKALFTQKDVQALADLMLRQLREGKKDEALTDGAKFVLDAFRKNAAGR